MASTTNYKLPLIDPTAAFNGATDINAMATATDAALKKVSDEADAITYTLPPATESTLGGVIAGTNVTIAGDGTISTPTSDYKLPAATANTLGGVIVPSGSGFNLAADGTLSIASSTLTLPDNSVTSSQIIDGAVTTGKIADGAVTKDKMSSDLQDVINTNTNWVNGAGSVITPIILDRTNNPDSSAVTISHWGNVIMVSCSTFYVVGPTPAASTVDIFTTQQDGYPFYKPSYNQLGSGNTYVPFYDSSNTFIGYCCLSVHTYFARDEFFYQFVANANLVPGTVYHFSGNFQLVFV